MKPDGLHISDQDLLLEADGELSASRAVEVRAHIAGCWTCKTRKARLEETIASFISGPYAELNRSVPEVPRALLRARVEEADRQAAVPLPRPTQWTQHRLAWATAALVVLTAGAFFAWSPFRPRAAAVAVFAPNPAITPGATRPVTREAVCASTARPEIRKIPVGVARAVFARYGIQDPEPRSFEVDYLIPPSLGGSDDPRNLWPQPYTNGLWSAHVKDALEDRLLSMVCDGRLDLATAQRDLATDWIGAYKKYFGTAKPRLDHVAFVKDSPWE